ncbi:MAG TPA: prephenate dehydratase [Candidatus Aminicenantes bacterium]|nr:prephenate dehydratase [Candidatus Aminicenantes bacterium]
MHLKQIRSEIDWIDVRILKLLRERLEMALLTRAFKQDVIDNEREREIFERLRRFSAGLLSPDYLEEIFKRIVSESRRLEEKEFTLIGFQGEHGAYSEMAARRLYPDAVTIPVSGFSDLFSMVDSESCDLALVPVENSSEGAIGEVHDLLLEYDLFIRAEILFPIHHQLLALPGVQPREIKVVYSHPQALGQCRNFIRRLGLTERPHYDTAGAARRLLENQWREAAVIAGELCSELYGLEILIRDVEDEATNRTRFLALSKNFMAPGNEKQKTSIILATPHKSGSLMAVLQIFARAGLNLTRLESRPLRNNPGGYLFFIDFQGGMDTEAVARSLSKVREKALFYKFLGSYPEA